ncbi:hypothetical protein HD598_002129 [Neomicrococcus aestuarii]|uniref:Uncharacterized protein n=1 Tax=Neomicrococcus aestuarii TaxID=556325 RepID=A0A7W8X0P4_9MICC|nr:hypothetical protein [Neomicrococcus aestuarii]MBB5513442.1 hypothetical protein [Neomicrococcus aestuarii]
MSKYRTEFMDEVARIVKEVYGEEPISTSDFQLGVDTGRKSLARQIGRLLAGTDTDPQTNDQWEAEVDDLTAKLKKAKEYILLLQVLRARYATENRKLRDQINH